jgi:drug/metabolite transporter (DMT)-like permease
MSLLGGALFGLGAAGAGGVLDLGATVASRRVGSVRTTGVVVPTTCLIIVLIFLASGATLPADPAVFLGAVTSGLLGSIVYFSAYAALRAGPVSIVVPVIFGYGGLTVLLSILLLGERPSAVSLVAALVATCGIVLAGFALGSKGRVRLVGRGVGYALITLLAASGVSIVATLVIREVGWVPMFAVARVTNTIVVVSTLLILGQRRRRREHARGSPDTVDATSVPIRSAGVRIVALLLLLGALDVTATSLFLAGLGVGPTWLVGLTSSFGPLVGIVGGITLFRERPSRIQWVGVGLVLLGGILLAVQ